MNSNKRSVIFLPNLSGTGGGAEIYCLNLACVLKEEGCEVFIITDRCEGDEDNVRSTLKMYGMPDFKVLYIEDSAVSGKDRFLERMTEREDLQHREIEALLKKYDVGLFINGTFGNLCGFEGLHNWHIVHFPPKPAENPLYMEHIREYLGSYEHFLCNSSFTARWFKTYYGQEAEVLYPPVNAEGIKTEDLAAKENMILTCGRITPAKKLREMAHAFGCLYASGIRDYRFVIAGLLDPRREEYADLLRSDLKNLPAEIVTDLPREELNAYFRRAKFYWHAMGLGVQEDNPLKMEHFGMTSAEALTFGCVPIVIDRGGQKEIVTPETGCRFSTEEELVNFTADLIRDPKKTYMLACNALKRAERYSMDRFRAEIRRYLNSV